MSLRGSMSNEAQFWVSHPLRHLADGSTRDRHLWCQASWSSWGHTLFKGWCWPDIVARMSISTAVHKIPGNLTIVCYEHAAIDTDILRTSKHWYLLLYFTGILLLLLLLSWLLFLTNPTPWCLWKLHPSPNFVPSGSFDGLWVRQVSFILHTCFLLGSPGIYFPNWLPRE